MVLCQPFGTQGRYSVPVVLGLPLDNLPWGQYSVLVVLCRPLDPAPLPSRGGVDTTHSSAVDGARRRLALLTPSGIRAAAAAAAAAGVSVGAERAGRLCGAQLSGGAARCSHGRQAKPSADSCRADPARLGPHVSGGPPGRDGLPKSPGTEAS